VKAIPQKTAFLNKKCNPEPCR